jgi:hypothetical protein
MKRIFGIVALTLAVVLTHANVHAHTTSATQLLAYQADLAPSPINGNIAADGQEDKWGGAFVKSVTFASQDGLTTNDGTILVASDSLFLYIGIGFNSQSASNNNYAIVYFDENHDHALAGAAGSPGEYYVKLTGTGPSIQENGGYYGAGGWQAYPSEFPVGLEAVANKHGTGLPQTWNFEFKIPLSGGVGTGGENFLNIDLDSDLGLLVEVFDSSGGVMYWEPTSRDPLDATTWGAVDLSARGPERNVASSVSLGHDPVIDGDISNDADWQHFTSFRRQVNLVDGAGNSVAGQIYSKSNATDLYVGLVLDGVPAVAGDELHFYFDYNSSTNGDLDYILTPASENGVSVTYTGAGTGTPNDTHFEAAPAWVTDVTGDGEGAVTHTGSGYEIEFRVPLTGTGGQDFQLLLGTLVGMNLEFVDATSGESFWWDVATNSRQQKLRVDAASFTGLGWSRVQTGAPVLQPVLPRDGDDVSGHFPFIIYATSTAGELGIVSAEFSDDLGLSWQALERTDDSGEWTKTWDTTLLPEGLTEIRIRAMDVNGLVANAVINVNVNNDGTLPSDLPTVTVTAPASGSYINGVMTVEWTAVPAAGETISLSQVSIDGANWVTATSPYPVPTVGMEDGSHILQVRAVQSDNLVGYSDTRLVLVDNTAPEVEQFEVSYPAGQTAARAGDVILATALVRDAGAGLDPATVVLDATTIDGGSHVMVDDGTNGDVVAGDNLFSYAVTVTNVATTSETMTLVGADVLGNASAAISATVNLDNSAPGHVSTISGDADTIYKNGDVVTIITNWGSAGHTVTADFSTVDNNYTVGSEQVADNGDGTYTIVYAISFENSTADASALAVPITVFDAAGNGPAVHNGFTVELDNTVPGFASVDADADAYKNGNTITLTANMDAATYVLSANLGNIDSDYSAGSETVSNVGNIYTITYTISNPQNTTPDGSYDLRVDAVDIAGNVSTRATSVKLDNTAPDMEEFQVAYPNGQTAARVGDVILVSALVRDAGAGLEPTSVALDASKIDGASHVMVDDGTNGDAVGGDNLFSYAVTVTSTATVTDTVWLVSQDVLTNTTPTLFALVELDNIAPSQSVTVSGDDDAIYKNTDVVKIVTTWDSAGHTLTADFSAVDDNYVTGAEQVTDNGDGTYTLVYAISFENAVADATGLAIPITAFDRTGNGPTTFAGFAVELDNTAPAFNAIDTAQDNYRDGETIVVTVEMDGATYALSADFSNIDSNFQAGAETVSNVGNTYTITYAIAADPQNTTPDGSYDIEIRAEDIAGNVSHSSTSIELDNTPEAVTILRPVEGTILSDDVIIDVRATDDTRFVRFQVSDDGGANWYNLQGTQAPFDYTQDDDATDGWTQVWNTASDALPDGTNYVIRVMAYDEQNPVAHLIGQDETDGGFTVDNTPPVVSIAIAPLPSVAPLMGEVYEEEILLTGMYYDLPDSGNVVSVMIEHRNGDGDNVDSSPIHIPAVADRTFSRRIRLVEGTNTLTVTAADKVELSASVSATITYIVPENVSTIGPDGGTVTSPDGTQVIVPPGALQEAIRISITQIPNDELPPTEQSNVSLIKRAHRFEPEGTVFYKPVDIVLSYTDADIDRDQNGAPDWDEMELSVFFVDNQTWIATDRPARDPAANKLRLKTNHFSTYDIGVVTAPQGEGTLYWTKNPFSPSDGTTCVFEMPEDGSLTLQIFDLTGQLVRTIASAEPITAQSSLRWDGQNDFSKYVGSGVYVYLARFVGESGARLTFRKPIGVVK